MDTTKKAQGSSLEVQRRLREVRSAVRDTMPYGKIFMMRFIEGFSSLVLPETFHFHQLSSTTKDQLWKCQEAYHFFTPRIGDHLSWMKYHEAIRQRVMGLLSPPHSRYCMDSAELLLWCEEVFNYLRNLRKQDFLHKKHPPLNFEQVRVDAMHDLVEVVRSSDDKNQIRNYYDYLIKLCQRSSLTPHSFVIQYPKKLYENAVETGGSARVYHGSHDGQEVAIKEFRLYANRIPQAKKRFLKESYITKIMHHPNIITFIGTVQEPFRICIIIPWMKNGDIVNYLAARSSPEPSKKELLEQVADGLHFVHEYGFAHGDLKGGNVLISDDEKALISDFGVATLQEDIEAPPIAAKTPTWRPIDIQTCKVALRESGMPQSLAPSLFSRVSNFSGGGTFRWMAPERLMPKEFGFKSAKPTFASDVFSYAMLAVEVYTGAPPHALETQQMAAIRTVTGKRPERPANAPDLVWEIIEHCWRVKADERPLMLDVYSSLACIPC